MISDGLWVRSERYEGRGKRAMRSRYDTGNGVAVFEGEL